MIEDIVKKLISFQNLSVQESEYLFSKMLENNLTPVQISSVLTALHMKGYKREEIYGAVKTVRDKSIKINPNKYMFNLVDKKIKILDTCGTGGSGIKKFNLSTLVSFVCAGAGAMVAKHGNRAMSSHIGSADILEYLGVNLEVPPHYMEEIIANIGIGFMYAPLYHPLLKNVSSIRKELRFRTIFNFLGPLCNPASANYHLLGLSNKELLPVMAWVLQKIGIKKAFVVHSLDLKDEVSLSSKTYVLMVSPKKIDRLTLWPSHFGLKKMKLKDVLVDSIEDSARIFMEILKGKDIPPRYFVLANASCCFYILDMVKSLKEGVELARTVIDTFKAYDKFQLFKENIEKYGKQ